MHRLHLTLLALPLVAAFLLPAAAEAGVYKVYSCKTPSGRIAPTDGWGSVQINATYSQPGNGCGYGGPLEAKLNNGFSHPAGGYTGWRFSLPEGIDLAGYRLWRYFATVAAAEYNATPVAFVSFPSERMSDSPGGECVAARDCASRGTATPALSAADVVSASGIAPSVRDLYVVAGCGGSEPCGPRGGDASATALVKAFEAHLRDTAAPVTSNVQGALTAPGTHQGTESLSFDASDAGSGVYRAVFELQSEGSSAWTPVATEVVDSNDSKCVDVEPGNDDPYEFFDRVPCKPQVGAAVSLDTTKLANGSHQLRVVVEDAAGNRSTVLQPASFKVSNAGGPGAAGEPLGVPSNGVSASNAARIVISKSSLRRAKRLRYGQRYRLIATIRNEAGAPVTGATVDVLQRIKLPGARYKIARKPVVTGRRGQVRMTVPAGPSRTLRLAYKANLLNQSYQAVTGIPLIVAAKTTLRRNRSSYRNGQTIRFRGQVRSKPIPRGGVLIDLQAYKRGTGWVTFATKRSGRGGRWRINYRLTSTSSTVRYKFRARVRQDSGYPYGVGKTRSVSVLVRP